MDIQAYRERINEIDDQLRALFLQRMEVARRIGVYKRERGLPILDSAREEAVLARVSEGLEGPMDALMREFYRGLFALSREYQAHTQDGDEGTK